MRKRELGIGGSKPLAKKLREKRNRPPTDQPWIWFARDMLESEAWRSASINTRRVVERLMLEHMAHAGTMNGKLVCTYDDFEKWGAWRRRICSSIRDAVDRGLIVVTEKGRASSGENRWPNKYALGWLPMHDGAPALNRWKAWTPESIFPSGQTSTGKAHKSALSLVDKPPPVPVEKPPLGNPQDSTNRPSGETSTTYNISSEGGTELDKRTVADPTTDYPDLPDCLDRRKPKSPDAYDDPRIAALNKRDAAA
ncbi:hypothetical protein [Methyloceanibacter sp.]|uniref:hypothetical protein n=1 Tax=Methyloceanibacter sp. TaxID=1965321 RepID=UPI003D9BE4BA